EGHPDARRGLTTLGLAHRARAYPAAADGVATAHGNTPCLVGLFSSPGADLASCLCGVMPRLWVVQLPWELSIEDAEGDDADEPENARDDRETVEVALDHGGRAERR